MGRKDLDPHGRFRGEWVNRSAILKERDTVNSTANLSTWRHLTNQSMMPESGIMEGWHQRHVLSLCHPFPPHRQPLGSFCSPIFFLFYPIFNLWGHVSVPRVITGTRICKLVTHSLIVKGHQVEANPNSKVWWSIISEEARARPSSVWSNS